jgi:carbon-monoxide dehydrogenase small subunit
VKIALDVNGARREVEADPWKRLLDLLREDLRLTGTKEGCGEGECGACTVLLDGKPVNSCLVAAGQCDGRGVVTVEGLAGLSSGRAAAVASGPGAGSLAAGPEPREAMEFLHEVQQALVARGGAQCGICTPGIAVCAAHVVEREPDASRARIRELLAGNVCRCTGYQLIVDAVEEAAAARRNR